MQMLVSVLESRGVSGDFPLKVVLLSGDWIPVTLPDQIHTSCKKAKVVSLGGATEAAIWSIYHEIEEVPDGAVSIPYGKPLANQKFYVLNEKMEQCPDWVPGDLYIGGKGLALEYLNKPDETNAHFMYDEQLQERIYKTGDIGRYWPDGTIEFMGREDTQVKIHGHCFMLTVLPVISTVVVYNIFLITSRIDRLELIAFSTVSSTLILALNLLVYDIYIKLLEQTEIRRENAIYEKQISLFQEQIYVKETAMLNDKMVRDKFYHQLSFIKELVYQRELSQLNEFIDGIMQNKKIEKDGPANSGNVLLDYIVNNKCEIAVKQGIECTVKIEVPYKFPFLDGDIFIILGNALDNAIEGALKCVSRRYIHIKIIYRKENLFIKISNSFDGKVKKDRHGHLISMKSDLTRYGLGLALIEKSVNKYNGLLNFDIDEENFTLTVLLYS